MTRLIKRYLNRKLYDTRASRYVTLDGIAEMVRNGEDIRIVDNATGDDITIVTFAQIIFEEAKRKNGSLGLPVLRRLIQVGGERVQEFFLGSERGRDGAVPAGERGKQTPTDGAQSSPAAEESAGRGLIGEILELPQKQLEQLQQRIDGQVRASLERVTAHPTFQAELRRLEHSVHSLEKQLARLRRRPAAGAARTKRRPRTTPGAPPA
ncbi:polyhydroxyalkanoate synthesis regulator DNA-binding domain-containing protein [Candidatus Binatia bacterium]|nr:polyhydroxyalkanoate synthesis regulator DNA-binding domain-containing protein [Candidatus Binatia bacterium]